MVTTEIPQGTYHLIILIKYSTRGHTPADSHQKTQLTLQLNLLPATEFQYDDDGGISFSTQSLVSISALPSGDLESTLFSEMIVA